MLKCIAEKNINLNAHYCSNVYVISFLKNKSRCFMSRFDLNWKLNLLMCSLTFSEVQSKFDRFSNDFFFYIETLIHKYKWNLMHTYLLVSWLWAVTRVWTTSFVFSLLTVRKSLAWQSCLKELEIRNMKYYQAIKNCQTITIFILTLSI